MNDPGTGDLRPARIDLLVDGIGCRHAIRSVTALLRDVPGVETVVADVRSGLVTVTVTGTMRTADLVAALDDSPYRAVATTAAPPGA